MIGRILSPVSIPQPESTKPYAPAVNSQVADFDTKYTIQTFFSSQHPHGWNKTMDFNDFSYTTYFADDGSEHADFSDTERSVGLAQTFTGFQYPGVGQFPKYANGSDAPWFNMTFQLDTSINVSYENADRLLEPVPYNSTLWFNDRSISLDAPFLSLPPNDSICAWFSAPGLCLCYGDTLLTEDFRKDADNKSTLICISEEGYSWGFSSVVTMVGIILEVCWMLGCFGMWLDVHINSTLFRMNRPSSGVVRNILDVAGAIQRELGEDTGAYDDRELKKALKQCPPVGFEVDGVGKVDRIAIVSMPGVRRLHGRVKIDSSKLYA